MTNRENWTNAKIVLYTENYLYKNLRDLDGDRELILAWVKCD